MERVTAEQLAVALKSVAMGASADDALYCLAFNLGWREAYTVGWEGIYSPKHHYDPVGGLLPGDVVVVTTSGWRDHNGEITVRATVAKVKAKET